MNNRKSSLPYSIAYVSSQTEQNPANKLVNAGPYSEGWISIPNTRFPQELVLDFGNTVGLTELTFVSHQSKIASSVILLYGKDASNYQKSKFQQIDSFQFTDNKQNNYKARESLCCHLPSMRLRYLKLIIDSVYQNRLNKGNQVGIVSIVAQGFQDDANADDPELAQLERQKREALQAEDFQRCQQIKLKIDNIINNRSLLNELNQQKSEAVMREDFVLANRIKQKIERIMSGADLGSPLPTNQNRRQRPSLQEPPQNDYPPRRRTSTHPEAQYPPDNAEPIDDYNQYNSTNTNTYQNNFHANNFPADQGNFPANNTNYQNNFPANNANFQDQFDMNPPLNSNYPDHQVESYDEKPIRPAKNGEYEIDDSAFANEEPPPVVYRQDNRTQQRNAAEERPIRQPAHQEDLIEVNDMDDNNRNDEPEELTDQTLRKEAEIFIEYGFEETLKYFYSKNVKNRLRGIKDIANIILSSKSNVQLQLYSRFCVMLKHHLKENVPTIFVESVKVLMSLTNTQKYSPDIIRQAIDCHIPTIVKQLGAKKEQVAKIASKFIFWAAIDIQAIGIQQIIQHLISQTKGPVQWNIIEEKLKLLESILGATNDQSIDYNQVLNFVFNSLASPKSEVRTAACHVLKVLVSKGQGQAINKMITSSSLSTATLKMAKKAISSR